MSGFSSGELKACGACELQEIGRSSSLGFVCGHIEI